MRNAHSNSVVKLLRRHFPDAKIGAEIGVWQGHFSEIILRELPTVTLYCVDPWDSGGDHVTLPKVTPPQFKVAMEEYLRRTEPYADRRRTMYMASRTASLEIPNESLDFVFIDADHTFESVTEDMELWHSKVKVGGLFSGHDYNGKGDRTGFFGVKRAVDTFATKYGYPTASTMRGHVWWFTKQLEVKQP